MGVHKNMGIAWNANDVLSRVQLPFKLSLTNIRFEADSDGATDLLSLTDEGEHTGGDGGPLDSKGSHQQVEGHTAVAIATQERHQEAKANKYHNMDILEDC